MALSMVDKGVRDFRVGTWVQVTKNKAAARSAQKVSVDTRRLFLYVARIVCRLVLPEGPP
jgi:hypothetical protein